MFSKKTLFIILVICIIVSLISGCGKNETKISDGGKIQKFTYLRPVWSAATYTKGGLYEKEVFKQANVEIDIQIVPVAEYNQKVKTIISSSDLPDLMWGLGPDDAFFNGIINQGAFLDISKLLNKYEAVKKGIPQNLLSKLTNEKGEMYFIPNAMPPSTPFFIYYRQDWFEKLDIQEPKTYDELVAALEKIKNNDPDGNGKNDTIPLTLPSQWYTKDIATGFGAIIDGWVPDINNPDKIIPYFASKNYVDFSFWLQKLRSNGMLDPDFLVSNNETIAADKFTSGKAAVVIHHYSGLLNYSLALKKLDPKAEVGIMSPLTGPAGKMSIYTRDNFDRGMYISAKASNPDLIMKYINWAKSDGKDLIQYGIKDVMYTEKNGVKIKKDESELPAEYKRPMTHVFSVADSIENKLVNWEETKVRYEEKDLGNKVDYYKTKYEEYTADCFPNYRNYFIHSSKEDENFSMLYENHIKVLETGTVISNNITRNDWEKQLADWREAGGNKIIEEVNQLQVDKSKPKID